MSDKELSIVEKSKLPVANPLYSHVCLHNGKGTIVSLRDLAPVMK